MTIQRRVGLLSAMAVLGSCSQMTDVGARYLDGKLAFVSLNGEVDCVKRFSIVDRATDRPVWSVEAAKPGECVSALPVRYGHAAPGTTVAPQRLHPNRIYRIEGMAMGGNYLGGAFIIQPKRAWQLTDLPDIDTDVSDDNANSLQ